MDLRWGNMGKFVLGSAWGNDSALVQLPGHAGKSHLPACPKATHIVPRASHCKKPKWKHEDDGTVPKIKNENETNPNDGYVHSDSAKHC